MAHQDILLKTVNYPKLQLNKKKGFVLSLKDSDVRTPGEKDISKKFKLSLGKVRQLIKQGAKHEKEHNTNQKKAEEVARDHIAERPDYYKMLKKAVKSKVSIKEFSGVGIPGGVEGINNSRSLRKNDQLEESPLKDKAKKVAMAGMTAANMYTMSDVMSRANEGGRGSPKGDIVKVASALPGAAGWGAPAVHYGKKGYDIAKQALKKKKANMEEEKKMGNPCWKGYKAYGMKKKNGKEVPNCVPVEEQEASATRYTDRPTYESAAWQRKAGKNPEGGLNRKGIASYRRENPGSKLSMAVTTEPSKLDPDSKPAKRRKSFCARMGGMKGPMKDEKGRPTRKALALRKWNCEEENKLPQTSERGIYEGDVVNFVPKTPTRKVKVAGGNKEEIDKQRKNLEKYHKARLVKNKEAGNKQLDELTPLTPANLGNYIKSAAKSRKKSLEGPKADIKTWGKRQKGITTAINKLTSEDANRPDKDLEAKTYTGATGITKTIHEDTKMETKDLINEAIENIIDENLNEMKTNLVTVINEKAMEKLEEKKKAIAANYFAQ